MSNEERLNQLIEELGAIIKDLGVATAYGYAVEKGYEGTEEEFAELMADYAHVAQDAEAAAQSAAESATAAHNSEVNAGNSEGLAEQAKLDAQASAAAADVSEANAKISELNADTHAENAEAWAVGTRDGVPVGQGDPTYHNNSKYNAELAATKADQAADSAEESQDAAVVAQSAATSATASATAADASKVAAKASEDNAKDSEDAAKVSEQNAKDSEDAAKTSEDNAKASENTASNAAVSAMNSRDAAASSATNAAGSASTATQKATEASQSATSASGSASTATQKATDASNSASAAAQSAADAAESATHVADMALMQAIAPKYDSTAQYKVGNLLTYLGKQYICKENAPAGTLPTNTAYFKEIPVSELIEMIKSGEIVVGKANLANNFDSKMVLTDNSGYLYRTTGGSLEIGEQNRVKKIIGASVPIIQLFSGLTETTAYGYKTSYNSTTKKVTITNVSASEADTGNICDLVFSVANGHKYCPIAIGLPSYAEGKLSINCVGATNIVLNTIGSAADNSSNIKLRINTAIPVADFPVNASFSFYLNFIDLTATFGTTVANRLATLETAQAGTGIAKAKEILVKDYYPYNVTTFTHTKTSRKQNTGFNQLKTQPVKSPSTSVSWNSVKDKVTHVLPNIKYNLYVEKVTGSGRIVFIAWDKDGKNISSNLFDISNTTYDYFAQLIGGTTTRFINGSNIPAVRTFVTFNQECYVMVYWDIFTKWENTNLNFHWDGERDGEYEPYQEWNYPVQDIELKGILSLDAQDNWVADGDEYLPSGVVDENYEEYTILGTETVHDSQFDGVTDYIIFIVPTIMGGKMMNLPNTIDKTISVTNSSGVNNHYLAITFVSGAYGNLQDALTAITGKKVVVPLTTPTQSSATPYIELQNDSNWGTEKWIDTRDVPLPVFSTCEYLPDLKAKTETAPESPDEDGDYIMHRENGLNSYGSLSTWLSANGYNKSQDLSSGITDVLSGINLNVKKLYKIGNVAFLTLKINNATGSEIAALTTLFKLPSGAIPLADTYFACAKGNANSRAFIGSPNGDFLNVEAFGNGSNLQVNIMYATA